MATIDAIIIELLFSAESVGVAVELTVVEYEGLIVVNSICFVSLFEVEGVEIMLMIEDVKMVVVSSEGVVLSTTDLSTV